MKVFLQACSISFLAFLLNIDRLLIRDESDTDNQFLINHPLQMKNGWMQQAVKAQFISLIIQHSSLAPICRVMTTRDRKFQLQFSLEIMQCSWSKVRYVVVGVFVNFLSIYVWLSNYWLSVLCVAVKTLKINLGFSSPTLAYNLMKSLCDTRQRSYPFRAAGSGCSLNQF